MFSLARRLAPCVVFLDEIDALFGARTSGRETGGTIAHRGVLTEFMQEMDGLRSSKDDNVIVIGATNRRMLDFVTYLCPTIYAVWFFSVRPR